MTIRHKVLISSTDYGIGKSFMALSYANILPPEETMLSLDYEDGQEYYVSPTREQADSAKGLFYVRRLRAPSIYEVKAIVQKIIDPTRPGRDIMIDRKPLNIDLVSKPIRNLMADIQTEKIKVGAICFDTITRLCEITTSKIFNDFADERGQSAADKMSQLTWVKVKDYLSELFFEIIDDAGISLIMTAWSKNRFDKVKLRSTDEMIADVLKNVNAFVSLSLMLEPNQNLKIRVPKALVLKSRLMSLPRGAVLPEATWEAVLSAEPVFTIPEYIPETEEKPLDLTTL